MYLSFFLFNSAYLSQIEDAVMSTQYMSPGSIIFTVGLDTLISIMTLLVADSLLERLYLSGFRLHVNRSITMQANLTIFYAVFSFQLSLWNPNGLWSALTIWNIIWSDLSLLYLLDYMLVAVKVYEYIGEEVIVCA